MVLTFFAFAIDRAESRRNASLKISLKSYALAVQHKLRRDSVTAWYVLGISQGAIIDPCSFLRLTMGKAYRECSLAKIGSTVS